MLHADIAAWEGNAEKVKLGNKRIPKMNSGQWKSSIQTVYYFALIAALLFSCTAEEGSRFNETD